MSDAPKAQATSVNLRTLRLRPGMAVQAERVRAPDQRHELQFMAAITNKSVMVGPHTTNPGGMDLKSGDECVVRGFTGQYDFVFTSRVIQTFEDPFVYAMLAYPQDVQARLVRQALRIKTSMPALVSSMSPAVEPVRVTVIDISVAGAMVRAPSSLGIVNDPVSLSFAVDFEGSRVGLVLAAKICHSDAAQGRGDAEGMSVGLMFSNPSQQDKLVLHYLTHSALD